MKKAAAEDLKALIEKVDCFIFDCDGEGGSVLSVCLFSLPGTRICRDDLSV